MMNELSIVNKVDFTEDEFVLGKIGASQHPAKIAVETDERGVDDALKGPLHCSHSALLLWIMMQSCSTS